MQTVLSRSGLGAASGLACGSAWFVEFTVQPNARELPLAFQSPFREAKTIGRLRGGETGKELHGDNLSPLGVQDFQTP